MSNPLPPEPAWTLLFVDDEANILSSLNRLFRPEGYRILTAPGGAKGLELLQSEPVDLVISDMRMPEMDGAAFLEQVAQRWPRVVRLILTGYADIGSTIAAVNKAGIYRYLQKPWEDNDIKLTVKHALEGQRLERERARLEALTQRQNAQLKELNSTLEARVVARTEDVRRALERLQSAHETLKRSYAATVEIFANLIEMRSGGAGADSRQVAAQAHALALQLALSETDAQHVLFAALLHDIGKIGLPDELLDKPFHGLIAAERALVAKHPALAQTLLMGLEPLRQTASLLRAHRERYDGKGYPDGLAGENIPLGARILGVVVDYHELQRGLIVPERLTPAQAQQFLRENRGMRYDPLAVDAFMKSLGTPRDPSAQGEMRLRAEALKPGMVLTRDLRTRGRLLLLSKGHVLDGATIARIRDMEAGSEELALYVRVPAVAAPAQA